MLSGSERETIKEAARVIRNWLILIALLVGIVAGVIWGSSISPACASLSTQTGCRTTTIFQPGGRILICTVCCNVLGNCTVSCS